MYLFCDLVIAFEQGEGRQIIVTFVDLENSNLTTLFESKFGKRAQG